MKEHVLRIQQPAQATPSKALPDGAITGNGDVTVTLAGRGDRICLYIGKADFWKGVGNAHAECRGGLSPLATVEILLPQLAYAEYKAEQDLDEAHIKLALTSSMLSANLKITVCAEENTVLIELDRNHPALSTSISVTPIEGWEAVTERGRAGDVTYALRGFDLPECRFPTYGICALRQISRSVSEGRERILWAINVCTNHDTAAYKSQAIENVTALDENACNKLLSAHAAWWKRFWDKSGVELPEETLELYWYAGLYAIACCAGNKRFPPGLWGGYSTADGMNWFGDYHLNYNYQAPFYALTSSNHTELLECYAAPLNDFLPTARRFAKEYLGIDGAFFPVGIGPLGLETDFRPDSKEHGHLFLGQKSNGAYGAVIPMMHWYGTRDKEFAKREYYAYLLSVAEFWENYLVFEDGAYHSYNDALCEVAWYKGPDYMPLGHDHKDPAVTCGAVRMLMKLMIDLSAELGENTERIPKWRHILDNFAALGTLESEGKQYLRGHEACQDVLSEIALEYMFPFAQIGKFSTPTLFEAAKNSHEALSLWNSDNRFCSFYPMAARLEYPAEEIIHHIYEFIQKRGLPNGMFRCIGGGLENSSAIPSTVNEMLLQSYEGIVRLFPVWDKARDARFHGLRANGAFVIDACLEGGRIRADILSERGRPLTIESPGDGYVLVRNDGRRIPLTEQFVTVNTEPGEQITLVTESYNTKSRTAHEAVNSR